MVLNKIDYTDEQKVKIEEKKKIPKTFWFQFNELAKKSGIKYKVTYYDDEFSEFSFSYSDYGLKLKLVKEKNFLQKCLGIIKTIIGLGIVYKYKSFIIKCDVNEIKGVYIFDGISIDILNKIKPILINLPFNFEVKINKGEIPKNYAMLNELEKSAGEEDGNV